MAKREHVEKLKSGVDQWNKWREENPDIKPDLSWANLVGTDLKGVNLSGANMKLAFCKGEDLTGADFQNALLYGTNLEETNLTDVNMEGADLEGAHVKKAILNNASLKGANLKLANFWKSELKDTDLTGCKKLNLDQIEGELTMSGCKLDQELIAEIEEKFPELLNDSE